eukprot:1184578-Prorocentrum_minimum.AAC.1
MSGVNMSGGKWETDPTFVGSPFQLDYLTKPTALLELGIDLSAKIQDRVRPEDEVFIAAYPSFNVNGKGSSLPSPRQRISSRHLLSRANLTHSPVFT